MDTLVFTPSTGYLDTTAFPDPESETETRSQLQELHDQTKEYINTVIVPTMEILLGASGDASALTELIAQINGKADLASPALTGTPTAPTAEAGTNTTQIATTAFVTTAVATLATTVASNKTALETSISAKQKAILKGTVAPTASLGSDGDIYIQY